MENNYDLLHKMPLFTGINEDELNILLKCLDAKKKYYFKDEVPIKADNFVRQIRIILSGEIYIMEEDIFGNRNIMLQLKEGDIFAEAFVFAKTSATPIIAVAKTNCELLMIDGSKIISPCKNVCKAHLKLIDNMLMNIAEKTYRLNRKLIILSKRTTREKILTFLCFKRKDDLYDNSTITIPFNRQQFADYLCVERSALSNELSKLKKEGYIDYYKNSFKIIKSCEKEINA